MNANLKNVRILKGGVWKVADVSIRDGAIVPFSDVSARTVPVYDFHGKSVLLPGFTDVHVHFREPGFSYKETIASGSRAAAHGGYTTVCTMPNLDPVPDCAETLAPQLEIIRRDAAVRVLPYGAITRGEAGRVVSDMESMAKDVVAFSDDGKGVQDAEIMWAAMVRAHSLGKVIAAHCEDPSLVRGGYIHDGVYARAYGHRGISSASEWMPIARDLELVRETGCAYHVCHVSTKESVELIRKAKAEGLNVTCETGPHYLTLDDSLLQEDGRFKMNPPLRGQADREALLMGLKDGTIDMIATDHAPHSREEKARGLEKSAMGIVGLETAFPLLYSYLVKTGLLPLELLVEKLRGAPCRRFGIKSDPARDYTLFDLEEKYTVDPETFQSQGRATPFEGWNVFGRCLMTACEGKMAWLDQEHFFNFRI